MEVRHEYGEADAHLHLPPPSPGSVLAEALNLRGARPTRAAPVRP